MGLRQELEKRTPEEANFTNAKSFGDPAIEQGTWLTTSLWNDYGWKRPLKRNDIEWPELMEQFGFVNYNFVRWKRGEKEWDEAMQSLIDRLVEY